MAKKIVKRIVKTNVKRIKRVVANKMRDYGDTTFQKNGNITIRVNKSKKKNKRPGEIIDTIVHEEMHARHPKMYERTVRKKTKEYLKHMGHHRKKLAYARFYK